MEINHFVTSTTFWKWDGQLLLIVRNKSAKFILQTSTNYTPLLQNSNEIYQLYTAQLLIERPQKHYSMSRICWRDTKPALRSVPPWHRKSRASLSLLLCAFWTSFSGRRRFHRKTKLNGKVPESHFIKAWQKQQTPLLFWLLQCYIANIISELWMSARVVCYERQQLCVFVCITYVHFGRHDWY